VAAQEILHTSASWLQLASESSAENPLDDMVGARLVGRIEIARFGPGLNGRTITRGRVWRR